jgi:hypothetical protein
VVEGSLQGGIGDATPFALGIATRTNSLFIRAQACDECATTALPLWWQLTYFGVTAVDPNADYDGDQVVNLVEYSYNLDPNKIRFFISVASQYVTTTAVPVQLNIAGGVPSYITVLVNDTNATDANWQAFTTTNLSVPTPTDGVYVVTVGLRGLPPYAMQTWHSLTLFRDTTSLTLALTNLAARSGSRPFIDPAGYAARALKAITWTVVDANGGTNSGNGAVVAQSWNLTDPYHTINWFECVDLALALGTNWISIKATDWAGIVAVTNFTYVFDTNGDTAAPALTLVWPQGGTQVSGDSLTVQAWTDDDTAAVVLQYTDSNGTVQTVNGLVERGGNVWIQNVPLIAGTNNFSLSTTDAPGNVSTTEFSVVQSSVALAVYPLTQDDLKHAYARVTGTVDDLGCSITVNGIKGTNYGNGYWAVDSVPLPPGGTVTFQATAQLSDGTILQTLSQQERDPIVFAQTFAYKLDYSMLIGSSNDPTASITGHIDVQWARGAGGTRTETFSSVDLQTTNVTSSQTVTVWPADNGYVPSLQGQAVYSSYANGTLTPSDPYPVDPPWVEWMEQSTVAGSLPLNLEGTYSESSGREVRLFTGGKATRQSQGLFELSAALTVESELNPDVVHWDDYQGFSPFLLPATPPVAQPSEQISLGALGNEDSGGNVWTVQPCGLETGTTPEAPATSFTSQQLPSVQESKLTSQTLCTIPTNTDRTTIGIGEQVQCSVSPPQNVTWSLIGGGSLSGTTGPNTTLTASMSPTNSTVLAQIGSATQALAFKVLAPSGIGNVSVYKNVGWGQVGTNSIGAMTTFWFSVLPTNVSFANVQFRENIPVSPVHHWPSGRNTVNPTNIVSFGSAGDCAYADSDNIGEGPWDIGRLYNGTNWVDFSYSLTWTNEYLNASSNWIPFAPLSTTTQFRGSDRKCMETYQGVPGSWQGPWAQTQ